MSVFGLCGLSVCDREDFFGAFLTLSKRGDRWSLHVHTGICMCK